MSNAAAASSIVKPAKSRNSTNFALRGSFAASRVNASSRARSSAGNRFPGGKLIGIEVGSISAAAAFFGFPHGPGQSRCGAWPYMRSEEFAFAFGHDIELTRRIIRLMEQGRRLQRLTRHFATQLPGRQSAQFVVHQRQQAIGHSYRERSIHHAFPANQSGHCQASHHRQRDRNTTIGTSIRDI